MAETKQVLHGLSEEQREIAELAFTLGAKYADRRFEDHSASLEQCVTSMVQADSFGIPRATSATRKVRFATRATVETTRKRAPW